MRTTLLFLLPLVTFAQSVPTCSAAPEGICAIVPKPPDAVIAAYFKADAAVTAARAAHDKLMEDIKKAVADSVAKQVNTMIQAVVASSQLNASCGELQIDQQLLQSGEVKCVEKPKK